MADRRQRRRRAALIAQRCLQHVAPRPGAHEPCGDWAPIGREPDLGPPSADRAGHYVVAIERAPSDDGHAVGGDADRPRVRERERRRRAAARCTFRRIDTAETPGRFVTGIAVDPRGPEPRLDLLHRLQRVHAGRRPGHVFEVRYDPTTAQATLADRSFNLGDQPITGVGRRTATRSTVTRRRTSACCGSPAGPRAWRKAGTGGLPHVAVYGLTISQTASGAATRRRTGAARTRLPLPVKPATPPAGGGGTAAARRRRPRPPTRSGRRSAVEDQDRAATEAHDDQGPRPRRQARSAA